MTADLHPEMAVMVSRVMMVGCLYKDPRDLGQAPTMGFARPIEIYIYGIMVARSR
jgi:hypothetical protein